MTDDERVAAFVRSASDEEVIAMLAQAVKLALEAGATDAMAKAVGEDLALDLCAMRGDLRKH